jgi:hypothetical protein
LIGHIFLLNHVTEGKIEGRIEMMGTRGRRRKQILGDLKETRRYWKLTELVIYGELAVEDVVDL